MNFKTVKLFILSIAMSSVASFAQASTTSKSDVYTAADCINYAYFMAGAGLSSKNQATPQDWRNLAKRIEPRMISLMQSSGMSRSELQLYIKNVSDKKLKNVVDSRRSGKMGNEEVSKWMRGQQVRCSKATGEQF